MIERLRLAYHVLRGRPLIYRAYFQKLKDGVVKIPAAKNNHLIMTDCTTTGCVYGPVFEMEKPAGKEEAL